MAMKQVLRFRAGDEHQQEQSQVVKEPQGCSARMVATIQRGCDVPVRRYTAEYRRPKNQSRKNFADDFRLMEPGENVSEQMSRAEQHREHETQRTKLRGRHQTGP